MYLSDQRKNTIVKKNKRGEIIMTDKQNMIAIKNLIKIAYKDAQTECEVFLSVKF